MFTREFEYTDYRGNQKKASYTFSLEKDEMLLMELGNYGGLQHTMKTMMAKKRPDKILDLLQDIVLKSVGEISPDGSSFYKSEQIREDFRQTKIFHDLLFEMMTDENALWNFIMQAIPAEVAAKMAEEAPATVQGTDKPSLQVVSADADH